MSGDEEAPGFAFFARGHDERVPRHLVRVAVASGLGSLLLNLSATTLHVALDQWRMGSSSTKAHAFAETFAVSVVLSALTLASAAFLLGARARADGALRVPRMK